MKCTNCGEELPENAQFCGNCGVPAEPEAAYCPNCGSPLDPGSVFCGNCGQAINSRASYANQQYNNDSGYTNAYYRQPKKSNALLIAIACIIAAAVLAGGAFLGYYIYNNNNTSPLSNENQSSAHPEKNTGKSTAKNTAKGAAPSAKPTQTPAAVPSPKSAQGGDYIFNSDKEYITSAYMDKLTQSEVRLILNEMYARHGYIFQLDEYKTYFASKSWYVPKYASADEAESYFNDYEKTNKKTIVEYETAKGWR